MARLQQQYREQIVPRLRADLKIDNVMQVPRIAKITVNMGVGEAAADKKAMPLNRAKVAIWNPGVKKADRIGVKTLTDGKRVRFFKSNGEMLDA